MTHEQVQRGPRTRLQNKVAIVTGAAKGIGKAIAMRFAEEGAHVIVNDIDVKQMHQTVEEIRTVDEECLGIEADVATKAEVQRMVTEVMKIFGEIDILVNNAGGSLGTACLLEEVEEQMWNRVIDVNLKGAFLCSQAVAKYMKQRREERIVNISSQAGKYRAEITGPQYVSAKAGVSGLTRQLAKELGPYGINVNAVAPGLVFTERIKRMWLSRKTEEERKNILRQLPLGRASTPEEQAPVVAFLCSDEASYITGVTLDVNGGWYMS